MTLPVELRAITLDNVRAVCALEVDDGQTRFVAPNAVSLAEAYVCRDYRPLALYVEDAPVGFVMHTTQDGELWIFRFMIDRRRQGQGLGRAGMEAALRHLAESTPFDRVFLSYVPDNAAAERLYRSLGFATTGVMQDGEAVMARPLTRGA